MKTSAADASSQEGLFIGVTRKRVIYSPIIFCIGLKIFRADGRSHFPVNGVRDRGLRGLRWRKEKCKRTGGGERESWIEGRNVNPEKNRTETSISSSSHFLPLSPSLSVALSRENVSRVFPSFPKFLSDGFESIGMHEPRTVDLGEMFARGH